MKLFVKNLKPLLRGALLDSVARTKISNVWIQVCFRFYALQDALKVL